jgi:hypothetical protein
VRSGDSINIQLTNNTNINVEFNVPELSRGSAGQTAPGQKNYRWNTQKVGAFAYHDQGAQPLGLLDAIVVDDLSGKVQGFVDGDGTITSVQHAHQLDKEFVIFMVDSTFWRTKVGSNGAQRPL